MSTALSMRYLAALPRSMCQTEDVDRLKGLFDRGTPDATRRAWTSDLRFVSAWKAAAFGAPLTWPEDEAVALRFVLDHSEDLSEAPAGHPARVAAEQLIALGYRRALACPATATLDRRIATWRTAHRMQNLPCPFDAPLLREALRRARRATARPRRRHSMHPITRDAIDRILDAMSDDIRSCRDRALFAVAFASGGRRRAELAGLQRWMIGLDRHAAEGVVDLRLERTKTTGAGHTPLLVVTGRAAGFLVAWLERGRIESGPVFRAISRSGRVLARGLGGTGIAHVVRARLLAAGYPAGWASTHGLRSGFLTEAALRGTPIQAAMRLSLHRSAAQAMAYYDEVDLARSLATRLLDDDAPDPAS